MNKSFDRQGEHAMKEHIPNASNAAIDERLLAALRMLVLQCMDFSDQRVIAGQRLSMYQMNSQKIADLVIQLEVAQAASERLKDGDGQVGNTADSAEVLNCSTMLILQLATEVMCGSLYVDGTPASESYRECLSLISKMHSFYCENIC